MRIRISTQGEPPRIEQIDRGEVSIGRVAANDLVLAERGVSSHHAKLQYGQDGQLYITDVGSTNGTFVNGQRIQGSVPIGLRDEIYVCHIRIEIAQGNEEFPPLPAPGPVQTGSTQMATPEQAEALRRSRAGTVSGEIGAGDQGQYGQWNEDGQQGYDPGQWNQDSGGQQGYDPGQWNQDPGGQQGYDPGQWNQGQGGQQGYGPGQWNQDPGGQQGYDPGQWNQGQGGQQGYDQGQWNQDQQGYDAGQQGHYGDGQYGGGDTPYGGYGGQGGAPGSGPAMDDHSPPRPSGDPPPSLGTTPQPDDDVEELDPGDLDEIDEEPPGMDGPPSMAGPDAGPPSMAGPDAGPPSMAGPDAGPPSMAGPDAGPPSLGGAPPDSGPPSLGGGAPDSGPPSLGGGAPDSGPPSLGGAPPDSGPPSLGGGAPDSGPPSLGGAPDSGPPSLGGGGPDSGPPSLAGAPDSGPPSLGGDGGPPSLAGAPGAGPPSLDGPASEPEGPPAGPPADSGPPSLGGAPPAQPSGPPPKLEAGPPPADAEAAATRTFPPAKKRRAQAPALDAVQHRSPPDFLARARVFHDMLSDLGVADGQLPEDGSKQRKAARVGAKRRIAAIDKEHPELDLEEAEREAAALVAEIFEYGPLTEHLEDERVCELLVRGPHQLWVDRGEGRERLAAGFSGPDAVAMTVRRLVGPTFRWDARSPWLEVHLANGLRIRGAHASVAPGGPVVVIERPAVVRTGGLVDLVADEVLPPALAELLVATLKARGNLLVSLARGCDGAELMSAIAHELAHIDAARVAVVRTGARLAPPNGAVVLDAELGLCGAAVRLAAGAGASRLLVHRGEGAGLAAVWSARRQSVDQLVLSLAAQDAQTAQQVCIDGLVLGGFGQERGALGRIVAESFDLILNVAPRSGRSDAVVGLAEFTKQGQVRQLLSRASTDGPWRHSGDPSCVAEMARRGVTFDPARLAALAKP